MHIYQSLVSPGQTFSTGLLERSHRSSPLFYSLHYLDDQYAFALPDDQRTLIL